VQLDNLGSVLLIALLLLCALPLIIVVVIGFLLFRAGQRGINEFANPDISKLQAGYEKQRAHKPNASTEQLVGAIIRQQAFKSGVIGAITGFGGFFTLPIALPVDIVMSLRLQAALVEFIASVYGHTQSNEREVRIRTFLIMSASGQITERTTGVAIKFLLRVIGKSFSKLVPFLGAAISFGVNYAIVRGVGWGAVRWYGGKPT
jgi:hypothetical protein